jgi:molybdopterin molybdotransferase
VSRRAADDGCFAYGGERLAVREALDLLRERLSPVASTERVPLAHATGRVLAETVVSPRDVPAFDNVAVDGYAFAFQAPMRERATRLELWPGRAAAGHPFRAAVPDRHALRVLTGAPMPAGTDTVALQEEVAREGEHVLIPAGLKRGANRRTAGEDVRVGQAVLRPGLRLGPQHVGVAAELGFADVRVFRQLEVAVFSTGDELVAPGRPLPEGGVYDANRYILAGLLRSLPVRVHDLGVLPDEPATVRTALEAAAASHHAILTSGGASRGDEDHVVRSVGGLGRLDFWQVAMKPGRPLGLGRVGGATFVCLPGNPVATMVCFLLFARPALLRLAGADWPEPRRFAVPAGFALRKKPGRSEYLRGRLERDGAGRATRALRVEREGSGILTSMTEAEGLIEVPDETADVREGDPVPFLTFAELGIAP